MNRNSLDQYPGDDGADLIVKSILNCQPDCSRTRLTNMLTNHMPDSFIGKLPGHIHLIHKAPCYDNGEYKGFVEISIDNTELDITK